MKISIDLYAHLSPWREWPVREKALLAFGMLALALSLPPFPLAPCIIIVMTLLTLRGARVSLGAWLRFVSIPAGFLLTAGLSMMFVISSHGISYAPSSLQPVLGLLLRSFAAICCLLFFALTTPLGDLLSALRKLGMPIEIVEISLLMYRLVFLVLETANAMNMAQAARLGQHDRKQQLRSLGLLLANLFPRVMSKACRMEHGLAARGWSGEFHVLQAAQPSSFIRLAWISLLLGLLLLVGVFYA
ncbi:cobalt ECF transporter T component CbiQ [Aquitalea magnusonii]|uniref:cobalt ECF transporter T component CbiQ n=1 Tax=Aquitalea magnusonii TaxID=332411 RepID=UPI000B5CE0B7|nr:cobalt ECF transporter T component CbiQ [Aquitalea magnusonii]